jgi:uncharacterized protein YjbI with pentapeptide repeats
MCSAPTCACHSRLEEEKRERDAAQERQVRQTAQHLLADHLRPPPGTPRRDVQGIVASREKTFWPGISLDLTGATLIDLSLTGISVLRASFKGATFFGEADFLHATFSGTARFHDATFYGDAWFDYTLFSGAAWFDGATFSRDAGFGGATFSGDAVFYKTTFLPGRLGGLDQVKILRPNDPLLRSTPERRQEGRGRVWPDGWTVRADADDPSHGTLVRTTEVRGHPGV